MSEQCPLFEKCPIYSGLLKGQTHTTETYRKLYCDAGEKGRSTCKRWQVRSRFGKCPESILPNTQGSVDQIGRDYDLVEQT